MVSIYRRVCCAKCGKRPIVERERLTHLVGVGKRNYCRVKCKCGNATPWVYDFIYHRDPKVIAISVWNKLNAPGTTWHVIGNHIRRTKEKQHAD